MPRPASDISNEPLMLGRFVPMIRTWTPQSSPLRSGAPSRSRLASHGSCSASCSAPSSAGTDGPAPQHRRVESCRRDSAREGRHVAMAAAPDRACRPDAVRPPRWTALSPAACRPPCQPTAYSPPPTAYRPPPSPSRSIIPPHPVEVRSCSGVLHSSALALSCASPRSCRREARSSRRARRFPSIPTTSPASSPARAGRRRASG